MRSEKPIWIQFENKFGQTFHIEESVLPNILQLARDGGLKEVSLELNRLGQKELTITSLESFISQSIGTVGKNDRQSTLDFL